MRISMKPSVPSTSETKAWLPKVTSPSPLITLKLSYPQVTSIRSLATLTRVMTALSTIRSSVTCVTLSKWILYWCSRGKILFHRIAGVYMTSLSWISLAYLRRNTHCQDMSLMESFASALALCLLIISINSWITHSRGSILRGSENCRFRRKNPNSSSHRREMIGLPIIIIITIIEYNKLWLWIQAPNSYSPPLNQRITWNSMRFISF